MFPFFDLRIGNPYRVSRSGGPDLAAFFKRGLEAFTVSVSGSAGFELFDSFLWGGADEIGLHLQGILELLFDLRRKPQLKLMTIVFHLCTFTVNQAFPGSRSFVTVSSVVLIFQPF